MYTLWLQQQKKTQLMFCFENLKIMLGIAKARIFQTLAFMPLNMNLYIINDNDPLGRFFFGIILVLTHVDFRCKR